MDYLKWLGGLPFLGWWWARRSERRKRDKEVFARLDEVLPEERLMDHLDELSFPSFRTSITSELEGYVIESERVRNDYLDPRLREHHGLLAQAISDLLTFLGPLVRPHFSPQVDRFQFLPDKNIDIGGSTNEDMRAFDAAYKELMGRLSAIENHYKRYRRLVAERLHL